jgi:hypothetical protein
MCTWAVIALDPEFLFKEEFLDELEKAKRAIKTLST